MLRHINPGSLAEKSFIEKEKSRDSVVIRFRFEQQRVRMAHHGDPVLNDKGKVIGIVTSCAVDSNEFLTGQAFIDKQFTDEGTPLYIYQNSAEAEDIGVSDLSRGKRISLPSKAVVVSRFAQL